MIHKKMTPKKFIKKKYDDVLHLNQSKKELSPSLLHCFGEWGPLNWN